MPDDAELLRRYTASGNDDAFHELVQRRFSLVYAVALRQVGGDAHLARDVAQRVFIALARQAVSLSHRAVISPFARRHRGRVRRQLGNAPPRPRRGYEQT